MLTRPYIRSEQNFTKKLVCEQYLAVEPAQVHQLNFN